MEFIDQAGRQVSLVQKIGSGGEGAVYEVMSRHDLVAKIYHKPPTPEKCSKLSTMVKLGSPQISEFAAWPRATLHEKAGGPITGIIIPRVSDAREIHELYSPAHRKKSFPHANWRFLVRSARNCAAAFAKLHQHNIVVGDVNQGNVFVSPSALVSLIDCDSFQIATNGHIFRCPVGVSHYLPPELQAAKLGEITRTYNHDNFGLAILIFHLLFMGRHPFAGRYSGDEEMPIERAIAEYRFAYGLNAKRFKMAPPPDAIGLQQLPQVIASLFERAFEPESINDNTRPSAVEWFSALDQLGQAIKSCPDDLGHCFSMHLNKCPWCSIMKRGGPNFFISLTTQTVKEKAADFDRSVDFYMDRLEEQLVTITPPEHALLHPPVPEDKQYLAEPLAKLRRRLLTWTCFWFVFISIAGLSVVEQGWGAFASSLWWYLPTLLLFWMILKIGSPRNREFLKRNRALKQAQAAYQKVFDERKAAVETRATQFHALTSEIDKHKAAYRKLVQEYERELSKQEAAAEKLQRDAYLEGFLIRSATIEGLNINQVSALRAFGVVSAADIDIWTILPIPGISKKLTYQLKRWQEKQLGDFRYSPARAQSQIDRASVDHEFAHHRSDVEAEISAVMRRMKQISAQTKKEVRRFDDDMITLQSQVNQQQANLEPFAKHQWWH